MDLAVAALDLTKAGAIIANMIESYLAGGAPLPNTQGADHHEFEDGRSPSGAASLHLHSPIDAGTGPLQSRKQGTPVQSGEPSEGARMDAGADPDPRWRSRPLRRAGDPSRRLQDSGQRRRNGSSRRHLLPGSLAPGAIQQGLAQVVGTVRDHQDLGVRLMLRPQKCGVLNGWVWYFGSCRDRDSTLPKLCRHKTVGAPSAALLPSRWGKRASGPDPAVRRMFVTMSNLSDIHLGHRTFLDYSSEVYGCVAL